MARKVYVSRQGLVRCPSCGQHVQVEREAVREASCPFCSTALTLPSTASETSLLRRAAAAGRSGLLAASLFGAASLGGVLGCSEEDEPDPGDVASDTEPQPAYGIPADTADDSAGDTSVSDTEPQPAYGIPADVSDDVEVTDAPDTSFEPEYGIPADVMDAEDVEVSDAPDSGPEPDYGLPADVIEDL